MENLIVLSLFFDVILFISACRECKYFVGDYATCSGEYTCVYDAKYVEVECWLKNIKTDVPIEQLLVRGECGNVTQFKKCCQQGVKAVEMITSGDILSCLDTTTSTVMKSSAVHTNTIESSKDTDSSLTTITSSSDISTQGDVTPHVTLATLHTAFKHGQNTTNLTILSSMPHGNSTFTAPSHNSTKSVITTPLASSAKTHGRTMTISTTPFPDITFVNTSPSPSSHRDDKFNRTFPSPSSTTAPEITPGSTRDTTPSTNESSDKGIKNELDYLFITILIPVLVITCVCVLRLKRRKKTNFVNNSIEMECMGEGDITLFELNTVK